MYYIYKFLKNQYASFFFKLKLHVPNRLIKIILAHDFLTKTIVKNLNLILFHFFQTTMNNAFFKIYTSSSIPLVLFLSLL